MGWDAAETCFVSSRGDKTALELFVAGVLGWEAGLRSRFENSKSN
jgi:hypothetical protein